MKICNILSTALLLAFGTAHDALALTEAERFRPIQVKCPATNEGKFEQLSRNLLGQSERIIWQFNGNVTTFFSVAAKDPGGPWDRFYVGNPPTPDELKGLTQSTVPAQMKEACDEKGMRSGYATKVAANRKLLGLTTSSR